MKISFWTGIIMFVVLIIFIRKIIKIALIILTATIMLPITHHNLKKRGIISIQEHHCQEKTHSKAIDHQNKKLTIQPIHYQNNHWVSRKKNKVLNKKTVNLKDLQEKKIKHPL